MNNLNDIVSVQIEIKSPATDRSGFGTMLLLGYAPTGAQAPADVGKYTSLEEVREAGWGTDDPIYSAAQAAFSQTPQPTELYIAVRKEKPPEPAPTPPEEGGNTDSEPVTPASASEPLQMEDWADTLDRAAMKTGWYLIVPSGVKEEEYDGIAEWTEAHKKMCCFTLLSYVSPLTVKTYNRSFMIYGGIGGEEAPPKANRYINAAWGAVCLRYEPGSETWALKTLSAVEPAKLTATEMQTLTDAKISYFTTYAGKNITQGGQVCNDEWIDVIRFMDWLENDMQLRIFNLLITNEKIMYTDEGIALIENQMISSLKQGQRQYGIAGTEYDEENNPVPGFTVTVPRARSLSLAERASRKLRGCKFTARLANAIHFVAVNGTLHY